MCAMSNENLKHITFKANYIIWRNFKLPRLGENLNSPVFTIDNLDWYLVIFCSLKEGELANYTVPPIKLQDEVWNFTIRCSNKAKVSDYVVIPYVEARHQKYVRVSPTIANTEISWDSLKLLESEKDTVTMLFLFSPRYLDMNLKRDDLDDESVQFLCLDGLSKNIEKVFNDNKNTDVCEKCGDENFSVHKNIITSKSRVISKIFENNTHQKKTEEVNIDENEADQNRVNDFMQFLYSVRIQGMSLEMALQLYNFSTFTSKNVCSSCIFNISDEMIFKLLLLSYRTGDTELHEQVSSFAARTDRFLQTTEWKNFAIQNPNAAIKVYLAKYCAKDNCFTR